MKTMAVALAMVSCHVHAQSSVTLFGLVDNGISYVSNSGGKALVQAMSGIQAPNLIGIRTVEDLGGGFQALVFMASQPDINSGTVRGGALSGRESYVGIVTPYGTVTLGRQFDYMFDNLSLHRWGHEISYVSLYQLPGGPFSKLGAALGTFDYTRTAGGGATPNAIKFTSAYYGGFRFGALYGFSNIAGQTGSNSLSSFGVSYDNGPLRLDAAYTYSKEEGIDNGHLGIRNAGAGGRYTFGDFALDALYVNTRNTLTGAHVDTYEIGGLYRFAPDFFAYANYLYAKGNRQLTGNHSNQAGITLDYLLSKKTDVYMSAVYQQASGGEDVIASVCGTFTASSGARQGVLRVGVRTVF
ncbi:MULTISPECIES: porin [Burkholderia]|nr:MULTISPECIES: porin [Burkholderia]MCA8254898.1 porin [Burkholderia sp. AU31624]MCI3970917.1 porin [Burkholderia sp. HI4860]MDN7786070.1 porin [Burkholderia contaminans]